MLCVSISFYAGPSAMVCVLSASLAGVSAMRRVGSKIDEFRCGLRAGRAERGIAILSCDRDSRDSEGRASLLGERGRVPKGLRYESTESHGLFSPSFSLGEGVIFITHFSALSAHNLVRSAYRAHYFSQSGIAALPFCVLYCPQATTRLCRSYFNCS